MEKVGCHAVVLLPVSENILGRHVGLLIPECELQNTYVGSDGELLTVINRPERNRKALYWLCHACQIATAEDCPLSFMCDTAEQAEWAAAKAARLLPNHRRIALERMPDPKTRTFRGLP